jgi:ribosomal protein S18 acetylase RimI-like enzyme
MNIALRNASNEDIAWLESFCESLMRPYVELTHKWDQTKFKQTYNPSITKIIQCDGKDIGMLKVEEKEDHFYFGDIQIQKNFQNQGIGTRLIENVLEKAKHKGMSVRLRVLKGNPAKQLYLRLGFEITEELENYYQLEKKVEPDAPAPMRVVKDGDN